MKGEIRKGTKCVIYEENTLHIPEFVHKKSGDTLSFLVRYLMERLFLSRYLAMFSVISKD
jgi:uncharacterized membrane protein